MASKTTAVAKKEEAGSVAVIPEHLRQHMDGKGTVGIDREDVALPRISLLQMISKEVEEGLGRPGDFFHLLADQNLGPELKLIPIIVTKAFMLFRPRETGGGLLARSDDGVHWSPENSSYNVQLEPNGKTVIWKTASTVKASGLAEWGSSDPENPQSLPAATKMMNVLCWLPDFPELSPSVLTLQRSSLKPGKKFVGKLMMSQVSSFGLQFKMGSEKVVGPRGEYFSPTFTGDGFVMDEELVERLSSMYEHYESSGVKVQETGLDEDETTSSGGSSPSEGARDF